MIYYTSTVHVDIGCSAKNLPALHLSNECFVSLHSPSIHHYDLFTLFLSFPSHASFPLLFSSHLPFFLSNLSTMSHHPCHNRESGVASTGFTLT